MPQKRFKCISYWNSIHKPWIHAILIKKVINSNIKSNIKVFILNVANIIFDLVSRFNFFLMYFKDPLSFVILNKHWISSLRIYNMTIFLKIDFWSNRNWQAAIADIRRTNDHDPGNGTGCFFYLQALHSKDIKSNQVYWKVHTRPNWNLGVYTKTVWVKKIQLYSTHF